MRFTIELKTLVKMVETVGKKMPGQKRAQNSLRLFACAARVFVEANETVAGVEALVLEDGSCVLPRVAFMKVLRTYQGRRNLTVEVLGNWLHMAGFSIRVREPSYMATPPANFRVFPVRDLGVLANANEQPGPQELLKQKIMRSSVLEAVIAAASDLARQASYLPGTSPGMKAGLEQALIALGKWPNVPRGSKVFFSVGSVFPTEKDRVEDWFTVQLSQTTLKVGFRGECDDRKARGFPYDIGMYEAKPAEDDPARVEEVFDLYTATEWISRTRDLFTDEDPRDLLIRVEVPHLV